MPSFRSKDVVVLFNAVDISGTGRSISFEESADILDDSKWGTDDRTKLGGLKDGSGNMDAVDTTGDWTTAWEAIVPGSSATLEIRPEGTGAGLRTVSFTAVIGNRSIDLPYDDLAKFSMSFEKSGAATEGTQ